jgi:hypothetical protein
MFDAHVLRKLLVVLGMMLLLPALGTANQSPEPSPPPGETPALTNEDVVAMVKVGLPPDIVIEKIRVGPRNFDLTPKALVQLRADLVPDDVIRLMINPEAQVAPTNVPVLPGLAASKGQPAGCEATPSGNLPWLDGSSPAMWYWDESKSQRTEINYERSTTEHVGFGPFGATLLVLHPMRATLRVSANPEFFSCINPSDAPLVHFSTDKEDNQRDTSVGRGGPFSHEFSISEEDLVPCTSEKTPEGYYRVKPTNSLVPGEYGFVPQAGGNFFVRGERVFTFGVD